MEEEERRKIENWRFMGRTKAYIHVPSSSAHLKGHADDILPFHVRVPLEKMLTG